MHKVISVKFPKKLLDEIDLFAINKRKSRGEVIREAIVKFMANPVLTGDSISLGDTIISNAITVKADESFWNKVDEIAKELRITRSDVIRYAVCNYVLDNQVGVMYK